MPEKSSLDDEISSVSCPCGASVRVDTRDLKPTQTCPECKDALKIVVTVDPRTQKKRVGILVSPAALTAPPVGGKKPRAPGAAPSPPAAAAAAVYKPRCSCGAEVVVDARSVDSVYTCGWCGASYTAFLKADASGGKVATLMKVNVLPMQDRKTKSRISKVPAAAAPPPAPPKAAAPAKARSTVARVPHGAEVTPAKENLLLTAKGTIGAQQLVTREKGFAVFCFCGREIEVEDVTHQQIRKCPECGTSFRLMTALNPKTKKKMVITIPRTVGSPK